MASKLSAEIIKGDNKILGYYLTEKINDVDTIINLAGATVYFTVKKSPDDTQVNAKIKLTSDDAAQIEKIDEGAGLVDVKLIPENTSSLEVGKYVFDVQVKTSADRIITCNVGVFTINYEVTSA